MKLGLGLSLSGGASGPAYGPELVSNGTFDTNTTGWTPGAGATLSVSGGQLRVLSSGSNATAAQTVNGLEVGQTYRILATMTPGQTDRATVSFDFGFVQSYYFAVVGSQVDVELVAADTGTVVTLWAASASDWASAGQDALFDNISIRKVL